MILVLNMKQFNNSPYSQPHCLFAHADTQPKPVKELALPKHGQTGIKHQTLTISIGNSLGSELKRESSGLFAKLGT